MVGLQEDSLIMTENKRQLLLKDLCARLPYGVKIMFSHNGFRWDWEQTLSEITKCDDGEYAVNGWGIHGIKPYLRPMSSMTEEEKEEYNKTRDKIAVQWDDYGMPIVYEYAYTIKTFDWFNAHHFDYRGLIWKGLALEAPEDMYKTE